MSKYVSIIATSVLGIAIALLAYLIPVVSSGTRSIGTLETIHGIPFAHDGGTIIVEEKLAHTDIFLQEPVFAKQLHVLLSFEPGNTEAIDVGVREGGFWLGYAKQSLYRKGKDPDGFQTKELVFPLTTAFQEKDRSIDLMVFSTSGRSTSAIEEADADTVSWKLHSILASTSTYMPTIEETKEYIKSIISRERAL